MNEKMTRALVEAGSVTATTSKGQIKTWATLDASAKWIKGLGVGKAHLEISRWMPGQKGLSL